MTEQTLINKFCYKIKYIIVGITYQISSNISKYTLVACQNNKICGYCSVKEQLVVVFNSIFIYVIPSENM